MLSSSRNKEEEIANASRHHSADGPIKKLLFCLSKATGIEISFVFRPESKKNKINFEEKNVLLLSTKRCWCDWCSFFYFSVSFASFSSGWKSARMVVEAGIL